jgi:predicted AlkP superfamily pyrophosphatase or phosphodiesterase
MPSPKVVIFSVDGLRPDAIGLAGQARAEVPNIQALVARGVYTGKARTVYPSWTLPAHSSMVSGDLPVAHGLTWDDYQPAKGRISVSTIFSVAKGAGLRTVLVVGKEKLRHLDRPGTVDAFVFADAGDADVANQAIVEVQAGFDLMFVHFPDTDMAGHRSGWLSEPYLAKVSEADRAIGRVLSALPPETTVILTADHGGHDHTHGSTQREDMTIPWILAGPRRNGRGRELTQGVSTTDTAPTALFVFGLALSPEANGRVVREAFADP